MNKKKIAVLGCGFMAKAIVRGLIEKEVFPAENIIIINEHNPASAEALAATCGARAGRAEAIAGADAAIICFKPQSFTQAMPEYARHMRAGQLLISIMAGIAISDISAVLPEGVEVMRAMPNLALSVGMSATGYAAGAGVSDENRALCAEIFSSLGVADEVPEVDICGVTALSGSGPAYFYYLAECMIEAAVSAGMDRAAAQRLCKQTFVGTAELWKNDAAPPEEMRRRITSAKGTTDAAIKAMTAAGLPGAVAEGMQACRARSDEMGREMLNK